MNEAHPDGRGVCKRTKKLAKMRETMLRRVSTTQYERVIPEMAETVGAPPVWCENARRQS
jgi:hypothetical protein